MFFLIEYDRPRGVIVQLREFDAASRQVVEDTRLELELDLNRKGIEHEVVILDAPSIQALRRTHSRYFESVTEILRGSDRILAPAVGTVNSPLERET